MRHCGIYVFPIPLSPSDLFFLRKPAWILESSPIRTNRYIICHIRKSHTQSHTWNHAHTFTFVYLESRLMLFFSEVFIFSFNCVIKLWLCNILLFVYFLNWPTNVICFQVKHPVAINLLYHEAYHHYINSMYPCAGQDAIILAGILMQMKQGDYDARRTKNYLTRYIVLWW